MKAYPKLASFLCCCFLAVAALAVPAPAQVRAGVGKRTVTPDLDKHGPVYLAGFGQDRRATGVHDDLWARCLALAVSGRPLVLCGIDSIGLFLDDTDAIRRQFPSADVVVAALHDHESPDTMGLWGPARTTSGINEAYNRYVVDRTVEAIREAIGALRPARITFARIHTPELDGFIADTRPPVVHDAELVLMRAAATNGQPIATFLNWANHPEALGSKNTLLTSDYSGYLRDRLEQLLGGTAIFINGAVGGMQSPLGAKVKDPATGQLAPRDSYRFAEIVGARTAEIAAAAVKSARPVKFDRIVFREKRIALPLANPGFQLAAQFGLYKGRKTPNADGTTTTPVGYLRFTRGKTPVLEAALIPGELYPELSVGGIQKYEGADFPDAPFETPIKQMFRAPYRMLFGLANDEIGYIIPKVEWDNQAPWLQSAPKRWYGEINSTGPEAAPAIARALQELVK